MGNHLTISKLWFGFFFLAKTKFIWFSVVGISQNSNMITTHHCSVEGRACVLHRGEPGSKPLRSREAEALCGALPGVRGWWFPACLPRVYSPAAGRAGVPWSPKKIIIIIRNMIFIA